MSRRIAIGIAVALLLLALDQAVKWWLLNGFDIATRQPIELTPFFNLVLVWNKGISFGMLGDHGELARWLLAGFAGAVSVALIVWMMRAETLLLTVAVACVFAGAVGNAIDRVVRGAVADFFDFHVAGWHFWAFNVADSAISVGVALLILDAVLGATRRQSA
ncbi:MAG: signal peptidase II [Alphaproteobacteria bacterium]|nr:signal peptidase II [Alphaproteobacteria bacterium]